MRNTPTDNSACQQGFKLQLHNEPNQARMRKLYSSKRRTTIKYGVGVQQPTALYAYAEEKV